MAKRKQNRNKAISRPQKRILVPSMPQESYYDMNSEVATSQSGQWPSHTSVSSEATGNSPLLLIQQHFTQAPPINEATQSIDEDDNSYPLETPTALAAEYVRGRINISPRQYLSLAGLVWLIINGLIFIQDNEAGRLNQNNALFEFIRLKTLPVTYFILVFIVYLSLISFGTSLINWIKGLVKKK